MEDGRRGGRDAGSLSCPLWGLSQGGLAVMDEAHSGPTRCGGPLADSSVETLGWPQTQRQGRERQRTRHAQRT